MCVLARNTCCIGPRYAVTVHELSWFDNDGRELSNYMGYDVASAAPACHSSLETLVNKTDSQSQRVRHETTAGLYLSDFHWGGSEFRLATIAGMEVAKLVPCMNSLLN